MLSSKLGNLSHCSTNLIHVCKKLPLSLDCRQSRYGLKYLIFIFFQFWVWLLQLLQLLQLCYFQKLQLPVPALIQAVFQVGDCFWARENQHPKNEKTIFFQDKFYSLKAHAHYFTVFVYLAT